VISGITIPTGSHVSAEERVHLCEALGTSIAAGWNMFHTASNAQVLAVGQAELFLIQEGHYILPSRDRAALYAATYNLIGKAKHLQDRYDEALDAHISAHIAAMSTGDPWYVAQSLTCQADAYQSLGRYTEAIEVIEEALRILGNFSDERHIRTKAHLLACWADNALSMREYTTVQRKLDESSSYLTQIDPNEEFDRTSWLQLAGKYAFAIEDYELATKHYQSAYAELPPNWLIRQAFVLIPLMVVYACTRDREKSLDMAKKAVTTITALNAPTINKQLTDSIKHGLLGVFPEDPQVQEFVVDLPHQFPAFFPTLINAS